MILRRLADVEGSERDVVAPTFRSRRLLLAADGMGFSFHDTLLHAGSETLIWYRHHLEAVYCMAGRGELVELPDGPSHPIEAGTFYALDGHEKHLLRAFDDLRMACVFSPALTGREVHDAEGTYPLLEEQPTRGASATTERTAGTANAAETESTAETATTERTEKAPSRIAAGGRS